jgi:serine/threonine-protein kinase RsbW
MGHQETVEPFEAALPADDRLSLPWLRRNLAEWLDRVCVSENQRDDVVLAIHEAAADGIEHGKGGVIVRAVRDQSKLVVVVTSNGSWHESAIEDPVRRDGLTLMRALTSNVEINVDGERTAVRMRVELEDSRAR